MVRDFNFSEDLLSKEREELDMADTTEKELWVRIPLFRLFPYRFHLNLTS